MEKVKIEDDLLKQLKSIIEEEKIHIVFQPIISLKDGEILGYEALSRGPKNTFFQNPEKLFQMAKHYGLLWELELVCRSKAFENYKNKLQNKKLFVNIDPSVIQDKKFQTGFSEDIIKKSKIKPDEIIFEITESTAIKDYKNLKKILDSYSHQGYEIALDDTGSGYSGLIMLAETHPHFIKIDMQLVRDIDKNKFKQDLMKTFTEFSEITGVKIIAEGIETEKELHTLIDLGIDYGQGYLIQKPSDKIRPINKNVINLIKDINKKNTLLNSKDTDSYCIGYLARSDKPIDINTPIKEVNEILSEEYDLQGIPVVKDEKVVGLVMRNKFYYQLLRRNTEDLENESVSSIMTKLPLIVEYNASLKKVAKLAISRREECTYDYIIVTKEGKYYGVVPITKLVEVIVKHC
ncbi:EAL domain-containing protein [Caldisalinibacter kiritimatiensis]|uniref:Putative signal transduction protein (Containing EAL, CBS and GGDEF domains) n=1 Tax=Caldisalinibacter kiritimatiensis TaxID=1304284 RepID=R1CH80_9FIRM|nr:EAL domain-containing protein [Caldisalinibacter kiritimatiensis]EOD01650.1 Putative signal transduction protein (containing EAL, CBS and GGDEF domains) [Caldisalinibacter kiritimatiensis]